MTPLPVGRHQVLCRDEVHVWEVDPDGGIHLGNHQHQDELTAEKMGGDLPICSHFLQAIKQRQWYWTSHEYTWTPEMRQLTAYISETRNQRDVLHRRSQDEYHNHYNKLVSFPVRYTNKVLVPAAKEVIKTAHYCNQWGGGSCNYHIQWSAHPQIWQEMVDWGDQDDCIGVGIDLSWAKVLKRGIGVVAGVFVIRLEEEHDAYWRVQAGYQHPNTGNIGAHKAHIRRPSLELVWEPFTATH